MALPSSQEKSQPATGAATASAIKASNDRRIQAYPAFGLRASTRTRVACATKGPSASMR